MTCRSVVGDKHNVCSQRYVPGFNTRCFPSKTADWISSNGSSGVITLTSQSPSSSLLRNIGTRSLWDIGRWSAPTESCWISGIPRYSISSLSPLSSSPRSINKNGFSIRTGVFNSFEINGKSRPGFFAHSTTLADVGLVPKPLLLLSPPLLRDKEEEGEEQQPTRTNDHAPPAALCPIVEFRQHHCCWLPNDT